MKKYKTGISRSFFITVLYVAAVYVMIGLQPALDCVKQHTVNEKALPRGSAFL
jgi:hypothetical protein